MKRYKITSSGLISMARVFVSCRPIMGGILTVNQTYLISKAKIGQDVDFDEFKKGLPVFDPTYDHILEFAVKSGARVIDSDVVYKFFGGETHFAKILGQINEFKLKKDFAMNIFFAHILIPAKITEVGSSISAVYRNGDIEVGIRNIVPSSKNIVVSIGDSVLVHYASIIDNLVDEELRSHLLEVQFGKKEFVDACKYVKEIDYNNFWDLCRWTKQKNESCEL